MHQNFKWAFLPCDFFFMFALLLKCYCHHKYSYKVKKYIYFESKTCKSCKLCAVQCLILFSSIFEQVRRITLTLNRPRCKEDGCLSCILLQIYKAYKDIQMHFLQFKDSRNMQGETNWTAAVSNNDNETCSMTSYDIHVLSFVSGGEPWFHVPFL